MRVFDQIQPKMKAMRFRSLTLTAQQSRFPQAAHRLFSGTAARAEIRDLREVPARIVPRYISSPFSDLLSLQWPSPPRNILFVAKNNSTTVTESLLEYTRHIHRHYSNVSLIFEPHVASSIHEQLPFPIYSTTDSHTLTTKVDMTTTLGGDGTILRASALFSSTPLVPPILSFSMGTLGFLGEFKFAEFKRAFREMYMSGSSAGSHHMNGDHHPYLESSTSPNPLNTTAGTADEMVPICAWSSIRGKSMGHSRASKILLRNRLKVSIYDGDGRQVNTYSDNRPARAAHAMNELTIHRGASPHLAVISIYIKNRLLTECVSDGLIIATPTGSTAYSLSSGGAIVHPLVSSLLLTPICPRSLSFRPLVLPANTEITLRLGERNRMGEKGDEMEVSVDGRRSERGVGIGGEIRVCGEEITEIDGEMLGGVPCVVRGGRGEAQDDDGWVGGLNGLLKFNYPFGEE